MASSNQGGKQGGGSSGRGFASMDPERQREIAREGGKAAHEKGSAHEFDSQEAREAGKKSHGGGRSNSGSSRGASVSGGSSGDGSSGTRGGSSQQHAQAGRQSHKSDKH